MKIIKNYLFRALILTLIIFFNSLKRELFFKIFGLYGLYIIGKSDLIKFYFNTDRPKLIKRFDIKIKIRVYLSESKYYDVFKILFDNYDIINDIELINYYIISSGFMGKCHLRLEIYKIISQYGKSYINVCNLLASSGDMAAKLSCEYIEFAIKNLALIRALSFQYAQNGLYEKYYNISKNLSLLINKKTDYRI